VRLARRLSRVGHVHASFATLLAASSKSVLAPSPETHHLFPSGVTSRAPSLPHHRPLTDSCSSFTFNTTTTDDDGCETDARDPRFPFALLPELTSLIANPVRFAASGRPADNDHSRTHTPSDHTMHRLDSLPNWPPVNFDGEFDALGVDVRAMAPATAGETETPRTSFLDVPDVWLAMDQDVFGSPFHGEGTFQSEHFGAPLGGLGDFATGGVRGLGRHSDSRNAAGGALSVARKQTGTHSTAAMNSNPHQMSNDGTRNGEAHFETLEADDEIEESDDDDDDDESVMRRAMRLSPKYPALLDAYFKCATVGAGAQRLAAAERRKRRLLELAARAEGRAATKMFGKESLQKQPRWEDQFAHHQSSSGESGSSKSSRYAVQGEAPERCPEDGTDVDDDVKKTKTLENGFGGVAPGVSSRSRDHNAESVDEFMQKCVVEMEAFAEDLVATYREAEDACVAFEQRVAMLGRLTISDDADERDDRNNLKRRSAATAERTPPLHTERRNATSAQADQAQHQAPSSPDSSSDKLRETLKRKYAASILSLKENFLKKRKTGKLPTSATELLKTWWRAHVVWPYPGEEEKKTLMLATKLNNTQVNNWFINQRKRHWHKLFVNGNPPASEVDATSALIERFGSIDRAIEVARKA